MLEHLSKLTYTADSDPRPSSSPRLLLSSRATFVIFADVVLVKNTEFEERISLKQAAKSRFIGFALDQSEDLYLATALNGLLKAQILET